MGPRIVIFNSNSSSRPRDTRRTYTLEQRGSTILFSASFNWGKNTLIFLITFFTVTSRFSYNTLRQTKYSTIRCLFCLANKKYMIGHCLFYLGKNTTSYIKNTPPFVASFDQYYFLLIKWFEKKNITLFLPFLFGKIILHP
jgi:hypothetical protein